MFTMLRSKSLLLEEAVVVQSRTLNLLLDYLTLTKPKIIILLLITAVGGMFLAAQGVPSHSLILFVVMGGTLGAGGANALNHYLDRAIDQQMERTRRRPVAGQRIEPWQALVFGILLNVFAFLILMTWVNIISALLTLSATLFYVFVYTSWLKHATTQNIVIGGAAGAVPPLVGWAAVTGGLALPAWYLFAIVFFWTPPHFWALALMLKSDYARTRIPMLPVVSGVDETTKSILLHTMILVALTILFFTTRSVGVMYLSGAIALGAPYLFMTWQLRRTGTLQAARRLYLYSLLYLALLFALIMVDSAL